MRRTGWLIVLIVILIAAAAIALATHNSNSPQPATNSQGSSSSSSNQPASGVINIRDMMFTPSQITVAKGGTVTWTNNGTTTHEVVDDLSNVGGPDSGTISPGGTYSFMFNRTGSFQYHDPSHTSMRGTIVVK
ncbi:MAG: cupredoxin domain-containing protein [Candidatus Saccharimonadales bacterium]